MVGAGSGRQWAGLAETLREEFQVIAPDLCGYGATTHWPGYGTFNLGVEADLVGALIRQLKKPAHVVGHSFGGVVGLQLALRFPEHLRSLTLIEPAAFHLLRDGDDEDERALRQISNQMPSIAVIMSGQCIGSSTTGADTDRGRPCRIRNGLHSRCGLTRLRSISGPRSMIQCVSTT
jgi:pimeloyl-ACP methyl ester carboxylesterase